MKQLYTETNTAFCFGKPMKSKIVISMKHAGACLEFFFGGEGRI